MLLECNSVFFSCLFQEDDADGELRRAYRRRTFSGTSRRSVLSTMSASRPLATPPTHSHHTMSPQTPPSEASPSSPSFMVSAGCQSGSHSLHHPPSRRKSIDPALFRQHESEYGGVVDDGLCRAQCRSFRDRTHKCKNKPYLVSIVQTGILLTEYLIAVNIFCGPFPHGLKLMYSKVVCNLKQ